ncbi:MAG TPA: hypothetical protein VEB64_05570 [Azospirillaceae bacterium]|nr:hypothetical protein [Azospirillaceae bacterium]
MPMSRSSLKVLTHVLYGLYAASVLVAGGTVLVGVVIAYVKRADADGTEYAGHFTWLIRTFWISLLAGAVSIATWFIGLGWLVSLAAAGWFIWRVAKGWLRLLEERALADPTALV